MAEITEVRIDEIYPHPDNPRTDLGDITELTESIKKNGIMQNLTVIPGHYLTFGEYEPGAAETFKEFYAVLSMYGFALTDPEHTALLDGTSELYRKKA